MQIDERVMDSQERIGFLLRTLYAGSGYSRYRMGKFEEYDLYSRNKDFLFSEGVITFTDTNGRLMALKPDVTLSIVKNTRDKAGELQKLYYHENVYRVASAEDGFREMTQVGVECMGDVDGPCVAEVLRLAAESLRACSEEYVLEISHLGLLGAFVDAIASNEKDAGRAAAVRCGKKSARDPENLRGERQERERRGAPLPAAFPVRNAEERDAEDPGAGGGQRRGGIRGRAFAGGGRLCGERGGKPDPD